MRWRTSSSTLRWRHGDTSRTHRGDQNEPVEPVSVLEAEPHPDAATHAVAHVREPVDAERVDEADDIGRVLLDGVAIVRVAAVAGAAGVHHHAAELVTQLLDDRRPAVMAAGVAMVEQDDLTGSAVLVPHLETVDRSMCHGQPPSARH